MNKLRPDVWFLKSQEPKLNHLYERKTPFDFRVGGEVYTVFVLTCTLHGLSTALHFQYCYSNRGGRRRKKKKKRTQDRQFSLVC